MKAVDSVLHKEEEEEEGQDTGDTPHSAPYEQVTSKQPFGVSQLLPPLCNGSLPRCPFGLAQSLVNPTHSSCWKCLKQY